MRLTDLEPSWLIATEGRVGQGITFKCPHCLTQRVGIFFANPIDGLEPAGPEYHPSPRWHRTGTMFEDISISPSVDVSSSGHWHGFIINGEIK